MDERLGEGIPFSNVASWKQGSHMTPSYDLTGENSRYGIFQRRSQPCEIANKSATCNTASHTGMSLCPDCSTSNAAPCYWPRRSSRRW